MNITFAYKGRYQIRDATTIEYLSSISKKYKHDTTLAYDQDIFGITDNVVSNPFFNRILSNDNRTVKNIDKRKTDMLIFLDGFNRRKWNEEISKRIKKINSDVITVCLFYWNPTSISEFYDYILLGEPELTFEKFLIKKIFNENKGTFMFNGLVDLNSLPLPDKKLFQSFINFKDSYLIYTSKGCPYSCAYCEESIYKNKLGKDYFRRKSPENVILELKQAKEQFDIREVIYKDSVFAWDKEWLKIFLKEYKEKINLPYKCFGRAEVFDNEIASMLKETKCYCVEFGVQTFNNTLKTNILKRKEKTTILMRAFSKCQKHHIKYDLDHLFGIPGEKIEDHIEAAKIYMNLKHINRIKCHNLTFYRESEIYRHASEAIKNNQNYRADFFSCISGDRDMKMINKTFQKYYKILPLLPKKINRLILKGNTWKIFNYIPYSFIVFFMFILAIKNKDRRFKIYFKYYPQKFKNALLLD